VIAHGRQKSALSIKTWATFWGNSKNRNGVTQDFKLKREKIPVKNRFLRTAIAPFSLKFDFAPRTRIES
jgi:P2-related tail formation protein